MAQAVPEHELTAMAATVADAAGELELVLDRGAEYLRPRISPAQLRALLIIERDGAPTLGTLATRLNTVASSASRTCDRLQNAGLLSREASTRDRREVALVLTGAGRRLLGKLRLARRHQLLAVLERMAEPGRTALLDGLREFGRAVHADSAGTEKRGQNGQRRRDEMPR